MNEIIYEGSDHSLINIPPFDGPGRYQLHYTHTVVNEEKDIITATITVRLQLNEVGGKKQVFKIMNASSRFKLLLKDKVVIPPDLTEIWDRSAKHLITVYNAFQKTRFGYTHPIEASDPAWLIGQVLPVVQWCNESNQKK